MLGEYILVDLVTSEIENWKMDLVVVQEVRWEINGNQGSTLYFMGNVMLTNNYEWSILFLSELGQ